MISKVRFLTFFVDFAALPGIVAANPDDPDKPTIAKIEVTGAWQAVGIQADGMPGDR